MEHASGAMRGRRGSPAAPNYRGWAAAPFLGAGGPMWAVLAAFAVATADIASDWSSAMARGDDRVCFSRTVADRKWYQLDDRSGLWLCEQAWAAKPKAWAGAGRVRGPHGVRAGRQAAAGWSWG